MSVRLVVTVTSNLLPPTTKAADIKVQPYPAAPVTTTSAEQAYSAVLADAGAVSGLTCDGTWYDRPDPVDRRIVEAVRLKRSSHNTATPRLGYIADPADVGGWPQLDAGTPCADGDGDGMPDEWERRMGYSLNANDAAVVEPSGMTRLDEYLAGGQP